MQSTLAYHEEYHGCYMHVGIAQSYSDFERTKMQNFGDILHQWGK